MRPVAVLTVLTVLTALTRAFCSLAVVFAFIIRMALVQAVRTLQRGAAATATATAHTGSRAAYATL